MRVQELKRQSWREQRERGRGKDIERDTDRERQRERAAATRVDFVFAVRDDTSPPESVMTVLLSILKLQLYLLKTITLNT